MYPGTLPEIVALFDGLGETERRENLIAFAEGAAQWQPSDGERFDFEDIRKDKECTDSVGIFLRSEDGRIHFKVSLGPKVQTLTRALTTILCRGLDSCSLREVIECPPAFIPEIVGAELVQLRSRTVYYVLERMKEAAAALR